MERIALGEGGVSLQLPAGSALRVDGGSGADRIYGGDAAELLFGNAGADTLVGGGGDDILHGGAGADRMTGGDGIDTASYEYSAAGVKVDLLKEIGAKGDAQGDVIQGIENVVGSGARDVLMGDNGANDMRGGAGSDSLNGRGGDDLMYGGVGDDVLNGSSGNDRLYGEDGNDVLIGGSGADWLTGGAGADCFTFSQGTSGATAATRDVITDFSQSDGDLIDLARLDAMKSVSGNQAFRFIDDASFSGSAGELRYSASGDGTIVEGDCNGDGRADFQIELRGTYQLAADDFVL
jgi:Ca2+-binding RTX toxin-like protein